VRVGRVVRTERGTMLPWMMACTMFVLLFVGMSLDLWRIVAADRQTSTAVDAAAAAGASGLDEAAYRADGTVRLDPVRAQDLALENLDANPDAARLVNVNVVVNGDSVTVTAEEPVTWSPPMRVLSAQDAHVVQAMSTATVRRSP
jgi:Flp pilus assembly protein TadG